MKDLAFRFPGLNLKSDLSTILDELKLILPWAEQGTAIVGETASGRYESGIQYGGVSDSNKGISNVNTPVINESGLDEKPSLKFEITPPKDAFDGSNNSSKNNPHSDAFVPASYSNKPKGLFGVPNVGAHVWVYFDMGDQNYPIYLAASFSQSDWNEMMGEDAPGAYENGAVSPTGRKYVNKLVLNQKGGTIEIINSDGLESLLLTHYSGSHIGMMNGVNSELATENKQTLVLRDEYRTVRGDSLSFTGGFEEKIVAGDSIEKVGSWEKAVVSAKAWLETIRPVAKVIQLFETRRTEAGENTAETQVKFGSHAPHPLGGLSKTPVSPRKTVRQTFSTLPGVHSPAGVAYPANPTPAQIETTQCPDYAGAVSPSSMDGDWAVESEKAKIQSQLRSLADQLAELEKSLGLGGSKVQKTTKDKVEIIGAAASDLPAYREDAIGGLIASGTVYSQVGAFPKFSTHAVFERVTPPIPPFGNYKLVVGNRFETIVGSGGYDVRTTGCVDFLSGIYNNYSKEYNVISEKNINFKSDLFRVVSDKILLQAQQDVVVDANFTGLMNAAFHGSLHVDGGIYTQKIYAPMEWKFTEKVVLYGKIKGGLVIGSDSLGGPVTSKEIDMAVEIYPHDHAIKQPAYELFMSSEDIRTKASVLSERKPVQ